MTVKFENNGTFSGSMARLIGLSGTYTINKNSEVISETSDGEKEKYILDEDGNLEYWFGYEGNLTYFCKLNQD